MRRKPRTKLEPPPFAIASSTARAQFSSTPSSLGVICQVRAARDERHRHVRLRARARCASSARAARGVIPPTSTPAMRDAVGEPVGRAGEAEPDAEHEHDDARPRRRAAAEPARLRLAFACLRRTRAAVVEPCTLKVGAWYRPLSRVRRYPRGRWASSLPRSTRSSRAGSASRRSSSSARRPSSGGHVNVSPKGPIGSFRIVDGRTVEYDDHVGSGAETGGAHPRQRARLRHVLRLLRPAADRPPARPRRGRAGGRSRRGRRPRGDPRARSTASRTRAASASR